MSQIFRIFHLLSANPGKYSTIYDRLGKNLIEKWRRQTMWRRYNSLPKVLVFMEQKISVNPSSLFDSFSAVMEQE